jgi:hypothetical protein
MPPGISFSWNAAADTIIWKEYSGNRNQGAEPDETKMGQLLQQDNLTFDVSFLRQSAEFRRGAIIHELLHIRVPNHEKLFTSLEKAYLATSLGIQS